MTTSTTFKIAVIGCGWVSQACHGPALRLYAQNRPPVELVACCDSDPDRAEDFRAQFGFTHAYTNYLAMLEAERPSVVCLNVPEKLTCEMGVNILERGFPLLAEKPPGISALEVDRLAAAASQHGTPNMVAFNRRYMPLMAEIKRHLAGHEIHHIHYNLARIGRQQGHFAMTGIHAVDAVRFLAGADYTNVHFHYQELTSQGQAVANTHLECAFANNITASIDLNPVSGVNIERAVIHCLDHTFLLCCNNGFDAPGSLKQYEKGHLILDLNGSEFSQTSEDFILSGFYAEDIAFFDAVRAGGAIRDDIQSGRQSVEIMQHMLERAAKYTLKG